LVSREIPKDPVFYLSEHYVYEVNMLRWTYHALAVATDRFCINVLIESFCVHARALLDFYESCPRKPDDVVATDFITVITLRPFDAAATSRLPTDVRTRVNKQIAHLTAGRENAKKINEADRLALLRAIEVDHAAFKNAVDKKYEHCFGKEIPRLMV